MKKFISILWEIIVDLFMGTKDVIKNNLRNIAMLLETILPFAMYFVGQAVSLKRGMIAVGGEIVIPIVVFFVIYLLRSYSNKIGKGITVPVPTKRFTEVGDDDEVSVDTHRVQEMILYVADLEDWLSKKGLL